MGRITNRVITIMAVGIMLTACGDNDEYHFETYGSIADSSIHCDFIYIPDTEGVEDDWDSDSGSCDNGICSNEPAGLTRERIIEYAGENYGVSYEWCVWLIGTTWNEGYQGDRYLEYAWACEIINCYRHWSVYELDCIWGDYYSIGNAYAGYYAADDTTLQMVWEALSDTDTRIVEVDGMIRWEVPGYYLIYDSPYYNCQVWGE